MGLFGGHKTYVASAVYNLAGPENERLNFLKTAVVGSIIGDTGYSPGEMVVNTLLPGPGIQARSFFRWALNNYQAVGVPTGSIGGVFNLSSDAVAPFLPVGSGQTPTIQSVEVGEADYTWWAEQWMIANHPDQMALAWASDILASGEIKITFEDGVTSYTFQPIGLDYGARYVYVVYSPTDADNTLHDSKYWIYKIGSGNAVLDGAVASSHVSGEWLPYIPFRLDNHFLSDTNRPELYHLAVKAYRKATGRKKYGDMIDKIADNESLSDIDHAYMVYGVCLNVKEKACKEYLFRIFDKLAGGQTFNSTAYNAYSGQALEYDAATGELITWSQSGGGTPTTPPPATGNIPIVPTNRIQIKSDGPLARDFPLNFEIKWNYIKRQIGDGVRAGHKVGDYWIEKGNSVDVNNKTIILAQAVFSILGKGTQGITIFHQKSETAWHAISIQGLVHLNHIYQDKSVEISAWEALDDPDDTGFVVPLHYDTLKEMSLVASTQMMTAGTFIVFNCVKTVKTKWYQTGIFKIFIFIVIIAITVAFPPAGGVTAGILGSAAAVGLAVGVSGLIGVIIGAIINALVAMIIAKIIAMISVQIFGAKWGAIIGAIVTMVVMTFGPGMMQGQSLTSMWGAMMNPVSIINMTSAVGSGISGYMQASIAEIQGKTAAMMKDYATEQKAIDDKTAQMFGTDLGMIDPMMLTSAGTSDFYESENAFLSRTLMTGTDIANMTSDMLDNFVAYTTALPVMN